MKLDDGPGDHRVTGASFDMTCSDGLPSILPVAIFYETPHTWNAGDYGFDPIGFSDFIPLDFLREAELKHGRICQLAVVGFAATDLGLRLPGDMHQVSPSVDSGLAGS